MSNRTVLLIAVVGCLTIPSALANKKEDLAVASTVEMFKEARATEPFFKGAFGYAVFPAIGKGGIGFGGAFGKGQVFRKGDYVGDTSMTQITIGFQLGGQAYSQIIFFEDEPAFQNFTSGNFEFGAQVSAVALTAGVEASAGTAGTTAGASTSEDSSHATTDYNLGMAVFIIAKGGLMYEASVGGQKFKYHGKR